MNIIDVANKTITKMFETINIFSMVKYAFDYPKYKKYLNKNADLKNKYAGQRCYILGNGPSIRSVDMNLLKDKYTFVVNKFYKSDSYIPLNPTFHCIYDKYIFAECKKDIESIIGAKNSRTIFLLSRRAIGEIDDERCRFVYSTLLPVSEKCRCDLTKNANTYLNVIPFAISCALYMGFSEIILLGCDFSIFASRKESHFYDNGSDIKRSESLYQDLQGHAIVCCQHDYLNKYAFKHGVKIINVTEGSLLDVYPQDKFENWI